MSFKNVSMNNNPKVTIILSVFNNEKTIAKSLESLVLQTYKNTEIFVLDDASTDNTLEIITSKYSNNSKIRIIRNTVNLGLTKSLNKLINMSSSNFIARHDGDDISHPERIEVQMLEMQSKNLDFVSSRAESTDGKKIYPGISFYLPYKYLLKYKNPFIHGTLLIRREIIKNVNLYDEDYIYAQDYKLMCDLLLTKAKYKVIKKPLYKLNMENNISTNFTLEQKKYANMAQKQYMKSL